MSVATLLLLYAIRTWTGTVLPFSSFWNICDPSQQMFLFISVKHFILFLMLDIASVAVDLLSLQSGRQLSNLLGDC
jgi:hypothetical protein